MDGGLTMYATENTSPRVYLDSTGDFEDLTTDLFLAAHSVDPFGWNGYAVPVTTAAEFGRYLNALRRNDGNSTFDPSGIIEADGALIYEDECGRDMWTVVGVNDAGVPLYALDGWQWSAPECLR